jgi:ATP-binding cassette subfamily B protein
LGLVQASGSGLVSFKNINNIFFEQFFTVLIFADVILLLDGGKIIGQGSHDDLLRDNAVYGDIIDSQFGHQLAHEGVI